MIPQSSIPFHDFFFIWNISFLAGLSWSAYPGYIQKRGFGQGLRFWAGGLYIMDYGWLGGEGNNVQQDFDVL